MVNRRKFGIPDIIWFPGVIVISSAIGWICVYGVIKGLV